MATDVMGFEGMAYYGVAGATASTLLENAKDISFTLTSNKGNTTVRGDSSAAPIETQRTTMNIAAITIQMLNDNTDTALEALRQAAAGQGPDGNGVAIRLKDYTAGKGPDMDCEVEASNPYPLDGEQVIDFTLTPSRSYGRAPQLYV